MLKREQGPTMKKQALLSAIVAFTALQNASASDLKECQAKIATILANVKTESAKGPASAPATEQYHLSSDKSCGVEYLGDSAQLTVTRFGEDRLKKFETIL